MMRQKPLCTSIALALALAVAVAGCGKTNKLNTPSTATPPASGEVELKLKWTPGEHIVQQADMKQNIQSFVPGLPEPMKQDMTIGQKFSLTVVSANPDGGHKLELQFLAMRVDAETAGKTVSYDSDKGSSTKSTDPIAEMLGKMVGARLVYFLDASNRVERIEGIDELLNRLSTGNTAAASLKSVFNEDYFKRIMDTTLYLPPKPVQPGDTWPVEIQLPIGVFGTMHVNYTSAFKGWEMHGKRNCALIEFAGTMEIEPSGSASQGLKLSVQNGKTSGMLWFDPELGMVIDSNINQDMTMLMTVPRNSRAAATAPAETQTITNQMTQTLNFKVVSVN